jgi:hypothetical protein
MHSSGSIARKFGPAWKQSTGHTSTQSVYLQLMQLSVTTWVMAGSWGSGFAVRVLIVAVSRLAALIQVKRPPARRR